MKVPCCLRQWPQEIQKPDAAGPDADRGVYITATLQIKRLEGAGARQSPRQNSIGTPCSGAAVSARGQGSVNDCIHNVVPVQGDVAFEIQK